ncbi:MAG: hypothetical protein C6H99_00935 [Epsilonproteobacteria bacterium]|nr:hypothetical protein [Campylobacterota bacterium]NPA64822.1 ATP-binding protein [Campylobacterota bacterium]
MKSDFFEAKKAFEDSVDPGLFVPFESNLEYLEHLDSLLSNDFKIALLIGEPGVGKSMTLAKFFHDHDKGGLYLFDRPFFTKKALENSLKKILHIPHSNSLLKSLTKIKGDPVTVILDEAQFYDEKFLEHIRILADTKKIRFILSLHQLDGESVLAKRHFQTRIFTTIEVSLAQKEEIYTYIQKKLLQERLPNIATLFTKRSVKYIYKFTRGNLRDTNKFLYTLFDILHYFESRYPSQTTHKRIKKRFLEMTAIELGYIDA